MDYAQTFSPPLVGPQTIRLAAGALIQALTVVNNSNGTVNVFASPGSSGVGTPDFALLPNAQSTTPINSLSSVALTFTGTMGSVYVHAVDQPLSAQSSQIAVTAPGKYAFSSDTNNGEAFAVVSVVGSTFRGNPTVGCDMSLIFNDNSILSAPGPPIPPAPGADPTKNVFYFQKILVTGLPPYVCWALSTYNGGNRLPQPQLIRGYGNANIDFIAKANAPYQTRITATIMSTNSLIMYFLNVDGSPVIGSTFPFTAHVEGFVQ